MRKSILLVLGIAMAAIIAGPSIASAQEEGTTEQVNWPAAAEYAELVDTYANDDGVVLNTYWDDVQNILWSQPASLSVEAAAAAFTVGPEHAANLLITQWIVPTSLWLCDNNKVGDTNCAEGTNYKWASGEITFSSSLGEYATFVANNDPNTCIMSSIERMRVVGTSSFTDYCDAYYIGKYYHSTVYWAAEDNDCDLYKTGYFYWADESTGLVNETYNCEDPGTPVARFQFWVSGKTHYSTLVLAGCEQ